jgi:hypothetical protein
VTTALECLEVLGLQLGEGHTAVGLRGALRGDEHGRARREPADTAHDVAELLEAEIAGEPGFSHDVVGRLDRNAIGDDRIRRMRDVAERTGVHQRWLPFERLHDVGLDRVLHHHRHRAGDLQHLRGDRLAIIGIRDDDAAETSTKIGEAARQREDRHHFRGRGDDELALTGEAVRLATEPDHRVTQLAVVHVQRARPNH